MIVIIQTCSYWSWIFSVRATRDFRSHCHRRKYYMRARTLEIRHAVVLDTWEPLRPSTRSPECRGTLIMWQTNEFHHIVSGVAIAADPIPVARRQSLQPIQKFWRRRAWMWSQTGLRSFIIIRPSSGRRSIVSASFHHIVSVQDLHHLTSDPPATFFL